MLWKVLLVFGHDSYQLCHFYSPASKMRGCSDSVHANHTNHQRPPKAVIWKWKLNSFLVLVLPQLVINNISDQWFGLVYPELNKWVSVVSYLIGIIAKTVQMRPRLLFFLFLFFFFVVLKKFSPLDEPVGLTQIITCAITACRQYYILLWKAYTAFFHCCVTIKS